MSRRPSFQFYPGDWLSNAKLKAAGFTLKGIGIDLICHLSNAEEFGVLRWPLKRLAAVVSCHVTQIGELVSQGILWGAEEGELSPCLSYIDSYGNEHIVFASQPGPLYFWPRMVRDEYKRRLASAAGELGGNPRLKPPLKSLNPLVKALQKKKGKLKKISPNGDGAEGERKGPAPPATASERRRHAMILALETRDAPKRR